MTRYTYAQLEQLWINAGGPRAAAPLAAAVAEAESGGDSAATNPTDNNGTQTSWGLWQISDGTHNQPVPNILDPNVNARQAVAKYQGEGNSFSPAWGTYDSGAYKAFLSGSTTPDPNVPPGTATLTSSNSGSTAAAPSDCALSIPVAGCILPKSSLRGLIGGLCLVGAGVIGLAAVVILAASAFEHSGAAKAVSQAVPPVRTVVTAAGKIAR